MEDDLATRRRRLPDRRERPATAILPVVTPIGLTLIWLSALLTLYTGWDYLRAGVRHLIEE